MKFSILASTIFALCFSVSTFADNHKLSTTENIIVKQELEVLSIDHKARKVTLKDRSGFTKTMKVGNDIVNFDQVEVGDIVHVNFAETIVIRAFGPDAIKAGAEAESIFARAPKGSKPAGATATAATIVLTIAAIDLENSLVTLKDTQGNTKTFRPRHIENLKKVSVGDKVAISIAEAVAISVKKGAK